MAGPDEPGGEPTVVRGAVQINLASGAVAVTVSPHMAPASTAGSARFSAPSPAPTPTAALPGVPEPQFVSADGRHILSSQRVADDPEWDKYLWTIYDHQTGQRVGELRTHVRYAPFFVTGSHVVYQAGPYARRVNGRIIEEPLQIRAIDLSTGQRLWSHPVRDITDQGPLPP